MGRGRALPRVARLLTPPLGARLPLEEGEEEEEEEKGGMGRVIRPPLNWVGGVIPY